MVISEGRKQMQNLESKYPHGLLYGGFDGMTNEELNQFFVDCRDFFIQIKLSGQMIYHSVFQSFYSNSDNLMAGKILDPSGFFGNVEGVIVEFDSGEEIMVEIGFNVWNNYHIFRNLKDTTIRRGEFSNSELIKLIQTLQVTIIKFGISLDNFLRNNTRLH